MRHTTLLVSLVVALGVACGQTTLSTNAVNWGTSRQYSVVPLAVKIVATGTGTLSQGSCTGDSSLCNSTTATFVVGSTVNVDSASGQTIVHVASTAGMSAGQTYVLGWGTARIEGCEIVSTGAGTITCHDNLLFSHTAAQGDMVESDPPVAATTAPCVINLWLSVFNYNAISVGAHASTLTLGSTAGFSGSGALSLSLTTVTNNQSTTTITPASPTNAAALDTGSWMYPKDQLIFTPATHPDPASTFHPPTSGASYTDGNTGTVVTSVSTAIPITLIGQDSLVTGINCDGSYILAGLPNRADLHETTLAGSPGTVDYINLPAVTSMAWDEGASPACKNIYWYNNNTTSIHKVTLNGLAGGADCAATACTDTVPFVLTGPTGAVAANRDTPINDQNWWSTVRHVPETISSIVTGTTTVLTMTTNPIPASTAAGLYLWISGDGTCPALTGRLKVLSVNIGGNTVTLDVNTTSGCGAYDGLATTYLDTQVCAFSLPTGSPQICTGVVSAGPSFTDTNYMTNMGSDGYIFQYVGLGGACAGTNCGGAYYKFKTTDSQMTFVSVSPQSYWAQYQGGRSYTGPTCFWFDQKNGACGDLTGHQNYLAVPDGVGGKVILLLSEVVTTGGGGQEAVFMRLDKGASMIVDHDASGNAYAPGGFYHAYFHGLSTSTDQHVTAAMHQPVAVIGYDDFPGGTLTSYLITNVTIASGVPTITTSPNYAGANADVVQISSLQGISNLNSDPPTVPYCIVAGLVGATFHCSNISTASGTYQSATAVISGGVVLPTQAPPNGIALNRELITVDATNLIATGSAKINRIAKDRSYASTNSYLEVGGYYAQSHPVMDNTGAIACWQTNFGRPDSIQVVCAPTGFSAIPPITSTFTGVSGSKVLTGAKVIH